MIFVDREKFSIEFAHQLVTENQIRIELNVGERVAHMPTLSWRSQ
jgi:hypothetical protein